MQRLPDDQPVFLRFVVTTAFLLGGVGRGHGLVEHGLDDLTLRLVRLQRHQTPVQRQQALFHRLLDQQLGVGALAQGLGIEHFIGFVQGDAVDAGHGGLGQIGAGAAAAAATNSRRGAHGKFLVHGGSAHGWRGSFGVRPSLRLRTTW
ncbi:hypothetical protein Y695_02798 [Hydrogenophaga sp. T4]|nr:hypothetical protein Y695_02798 [Hydrogenophaga sp. T4]